MHDGDTLYDILGIEILASADDVRKAYRKLALKWHPDKQNPQDDQQLALEKFRQVTNAYEILSDEKERQWYDSRLRRQQKSSKSFHTTQGPPDVFSEVAPALFEREYMTGHFSFDAFAPLLQKIAILENGQYPDYEECPVQIFYAEWGSFATSLDFAWVTDTISATQRVDRRVRRAIDQENAKERKQARKEYNENIRVFIEFMKKRDPKYRAWHALYTKEKEAKEAAARREKEEREKAKKEKKNKMRIEFIEDEIEEEGELHDVWYCPACEKYFKSSGSFSSHEKSKKHMKNVEIMKQVLLLEDQDLGVSSAVGSDTRLEEEADTRESPQSNSSDTKLSSSPPASVSAVDSDTRLEADGQKEVARSQKMEKKQNKKKRRDKTKVKKKVGTLACNVCSAEFNSRNQLFKHIKETGHASSQSIIHGG